MDEMIEKTVPPSILLQRELDLGGYSEGLSESDALAELQSMVSKNKVSHRADAARWRGRGEAGGRRGGGRARGQERVVVPTRSASARNARVLRPRVSACDRAECLPCDASG